MSSTLSGKQNREVNLRMHPLATTLVLASNRMRFRKRTSCGVSSPSCVHDDVSHAHRGGRTGVALTIDPAHVAEVRDNLGASHLRLLDLEPTTRLHRQPRNGALLFHLHAS